MELPEIATIKQLFKIVAEPDASKSEKEFPSISIENPLEKLHAVANSIVLSAKHCAPSTAVVARRLLAHLSTLPFSYVQQLMSDDGTTHSDGHLRSLIFEAKVDAVYLHRGLELVPPVITRHKLSSEVVKLAVDTIYSYNVSRLAWLPKKKRSLSLWKKMSIDNVAIMKSFVLMFNLPQSLFKDGHP